MLALAATVAGTSVAAVAAPYAAIVLDMRTGRTVYEHHADRQQHPASLTKLMTLYLTFEAIESGQLGLDQKVRVSKHAALQPASKLYLKAGQRVSIRHLIRAAAIKSANDAAMVLSEAVGGSQRRFAEMMTAKARELGMTRTRFRNPHGLTSDGHLSTARDMSRLGRALYFHFPEYYNVFGRKYAYAAGKRVNTTNRLLHSYNGAEGMKTGYTRAAGYNLLATASRGTQRVMAVILGGKSSAWRNQRMASLLDRGFRETPRLAREIPPSSGGGRSILVVEAPLPEAKPGTTPTGIAAIAAVLDTPARAAVPTSAVLASTSAFAPVRSETPPRRAGSTAGEARRRVARAGDSSAARGPVPDARPGWSVQLGAFRDEAAAVARLNSVTLADLPMLSGGVPVIAREKTRSGRQMYKVRVTSLDQVDARAACATVKRAGSDCLAIAPR